MKKPIRILVVDDSLVCREMLASCLGSATDMEVVGKAGSGKEAILLNRELRPNIITMDVQMPGLDGFATIEEIMASTPVPILVVTSAPILDGVDQTFRALSAGALDLVAKPDPVGTGVQGLQERVRLLAGIRVIRRLRKRRRSPVLLTDNQQRQFSIVAIVSSTGGPKALLEILQTLPRAFPCAILVTQHLPDQYSAGFATWLNSELMLDVAEAHNGETIRPGRVYVAPSGVHLLVRNPGVVVLSDDPPVRSLRPSGTPMLRSVAKVYGREALGIVLTGIGSDGAEGLLELRRAGGLCLAQDKESCVVFGMPRSAIELGAVDLVEDIAGIRDRLLCLEGPA